MRTIFKLEKCYLKEHCRMREHGFIRPAGYLDLGFFSSRKKAEEFMRQYISDTDNSNTFAFFITEKAVDKVRYISHLAHEHPSPVNLFKPTRKITKAQRELLVSQMLEKNEL